MNTIPTYRPSKILIVDDNEVNRVLLETIIEELNVSVTHACSGYEAALAASKEDFTVILMDVIMPNFDGFEATELILANEKNKHIPIILITALSNKYQPTKAYEAGAVDYIAKPVQPIVVLNKVKLFIELEHQREIAQHQKEIAEQANYTKSLFFSTMTHELRTPLNSMIGFTTRLKKNLLGKIPNKDFCALETILDSAHHQLHLVNDLLDASALDAEKLHLRLNTVSVEEVVDTAVQQTKVLAEQKGLKLIWPGCEEDVSATLDFTRTLQIIINLLSNAIKYTSQGEVSVAVAHNNCGDVEITIQDTGIGIRKENIADLFKLFVQLEDGHELKQEGIGLGLYITSKLTSLQGGTINVESEFGVGSRFTLTFPASFKHPVSKVFNASMQQSV